MSIFLLECHAGVEPAPSVWKTEVLADIRMAHNGTYEWIRTTDLMGMNQPLLTN